MIHALRGKLIRKHPTFVIVDCAGVGFGVHVTPKDAERIGTVEAIEYADHEAAIRMEREMGFVAEADADDPSMRIVRRVFSREDAV